MAERASGGARRGWLRGLLASVAVSVPHGGAAGARGSPARAGPAGVADVRDFGAVGDGVSDDTAAIQAAIERANRETGRQCVYAPSLSGGPGRLDPPGEPGLAARRSGGGAAVLPEPMIRPLLADGTLAEILPRPARTIRFEAAIRQTESDPLVLELFRRAAELRVDC